MIPYYLFMEAKLKKYQGVFNVKSLEKRHDKFGKTGLNNWSISKSPKRETEPGVRKGKRSLLACHAHTRCKFSNETTRN